MKYETMSPEDLARRFKPTTENEKILHDAIVSLVNDRELAKHIIYKVVDDLSDLLLYKYDY